ncbi:MAG: hypothetical protein EXX96DRAFT_620960 [Benjaminiella poitrasii]|nr:MAG: hypothetical protein EXX96DRAFT_620960 [Benjaminiella poitrasii]
MSTVTFYHHLPSGEFVSDKLVDEESEYQPKQDVNGMPIKSLYQSMEGLDLEGIPLLETVSTPIIQAITKSLIYFFDAE